MDIRFAPSAATDTGTLVLFSAKDLVLSGAAQSADETSGGSLRRAARVGRFEGEKGKLLDMLAPANIDADRLIIAGMGKPGQGKALDFQKLGAAVAAKVLRSGTTTLVADFSGVSDLGMDVADAAANFAAGLQLRSYAFDQYKTKLPDAQKVSLAEAVIVGAGDRAADVYADLDQVAAGVSFTKDLISEPANIIYPESFVERVKSLGLDGLKIETLDENQMREKGMHALLGVAQGSAKKPRLLIMEWDGTGGEKSVETVFVGKGVTFDSGGISIKPGAGMEDMKWDMGGAGTVAGLMVALATRKAKARVVGICGLVENMPDADAQRPGDVVTSMSGQTIEVINTDAEGRLVLCDAMWWAQETYKPKVVVDLATLTGAIIIGLGHHHAGLFSNDDTLAEDLTEAGKACGDLLWRLPIGDDYDKQIESQIADMKNVGGRDAGSITAAQFLHRFVQDGVKWAHLDIAGVVWSAKPGALHDKGATGYGVRLLDEYVRRTLEG